MPSDYSFYEINISSNFSFRDDFLGRYRRLRSLDALVQFFFCKTLLRSAVWANERYF